MKIVCKFSLMLMAALLAVTTAYGGDRIRNVVLMIGDGMGLAQVYAAMNHADTASLNLERAHCTGLVKTHSASSRVTDSAAAGTALASGHKTTNAFIGLAPDRQPVRNLTEASAANGLSSGVVVTCSVTNATPAAFIAHNDSRKNEQAIALDYLGSEVDVVFGGGRSEFVRREDGRNLIDEMAARGYRILDSQEQMDDVAEGKVLGLFAEKNLPGMRSGRGDYLPKATERVLEILSNNSKKGFFAMIEGSLIDGACHNNDIEGVVRETLDFDRAVGVAFDFADRHRGTLVVVLADHETGGLTVASYAKRYTLGDGVHFSTGGHSGVMVPVYAYGPGAENFTGIMENTEIPKIIGRLLRLK